MTNITHNMMIDIIIPVYNACLDLKECVESIIKWTSDSNRIIIINDKSTEKELYEYLETLKRRNLKNFTIIENDENLGFVGTVNKGMKMSNINDVILLNSDTIVTKNWLEKIQYSAYRYPHIGTVTPLTNNGTICSVPNFLEDNKVPKGFTIDSFAELIERISSNNIYEVPTAVGFAMYIKREVINKIGYFDDILYGKGYGEENDFSFRAKEAGYINIICDNTYIYHNGSMSFGKTRNKRIEENFKKLNYRYPNYSLEIEKFILRNPLSDIHNKIKRYVETDNLKNILYVLHNNIEEGLDHPIGGTELHVKDIIIEYGKSVFFVLYTSGSNIFLDKYVDGEIFMKKSFHMSRNLEARDMYNYEYSEIFSSILEYYKIDLVHIHHLVKNTFDVIDVSKNKKVPIIFTLHDFYMISPTINLLNKDDELCENIREETIEVLYSKGYSKDFLDYWNDNCLKVLNNVDLIVTPSKSAKIIYEDYYKCKIKTPINVIEHGVLHNDQEFKKAIYNSNEKFKIAFIGGISKIKGSQIILKILKEMKKNKNVEFHIYGNIGDPDLNIYESKNLIKHGRYEKSDIIKKLKEENINMVSLFSIWPETFSYTLSESFAANIPTLVYDIGALGDRVFENINGWKVDMKASTKDVVHRIEEIISNYNSYDFKFDLKTTKDMVDEYRIIYDNLCKLKEPRVYSNKSYRLLNENILSSMSTDVGRENSNYKFSYEYKLVNYIRNKKIIFLPLRKLFFVTLKLKKKWRK